MAGCHGGGARSRLLGRVSTGWVGLDLTFFNPLSTHLTHVEGAPRLQLTVLVVTLVWCALEESLGLTSQRFTQFGADPDRIIVLDQFDANWESHLKAVIEETGASGVVIDTLAQFAALVGVRDENSSGEITAKISAPLTRLTRETQAGILLLAHARKSDGRYRGSSAIGALTDMNLEMTTPREGDSIRKISAKGRWSLDDFTLSFDGEDYTLAEGELSLEARIVRFIKKESGCSQQQIRSNVQGATSRIRDALESLEALGRIEKRGDQSGFEYCLPEAQPTVDLKTTDGTIPGPAKSPLGTTTGPPPGTTPVLISRLKVEESGPVEDLDLYTLSVDDLPEPSAEDPHRYENLEMLALCTTELES